MSFILLRHPRGLCSWLFSLLLPSSSLCEDADPSTLISHFCGQEREGEAGGGGWDQERKNCSLPRSLSPFPGFVCKLLGRQCHPAALLRQRRAQRGWCQGLWPSPEVGMGKIGPLGRLSPHTCPRERESEPGWAVGLGTGSLPASSIRDLSAPEMGWLLYLPFSYWFGTWLAGLQSKGDSVGIKDSCLGPQCLPLACVGALGRATYPLPHFCPAFCGEDRYSEAGRGRMVFSVPPGPQNDPQGRPV